MGKFNFFNVTDVDLFKSKLKLFQERASLVKDDRTTLTTWNIRVASGNKMDYATIMLEAPESPQVEEDGGSSTPLGIVQSKGLVPTTLLYAQAGASGKKSWEDKRKMPQFSLPLTVPHNSRLRLAVESIEKALCELVEAEGPKRGAEAPFFKHLMVNSKLRRGLGGLNEATSFTVNISPVCVFANRSIVPASNIQVGHVHQWNVNPAQHRSRVTKMILVPTSVTLMRSADNIMRRVVVNFFVDYVEAINAKTPEERLDAILANSAGNEDEGMALRLKMAMMMADAGAPDTSSPHDWQETEELYDSEEDEEEVEEIPSTPPQKTAAARKRKEELGSSAPKKRSRAES